MRIGYIGLGEMGASMARHRASWQPPIVICDLSDAAAQPFVDQGAVRVSTAREMAPLVDVVSIVVVDDDQVRAVVAGPDGLLADPHEGLVIAIHSTIHAETAIELAELAAPMGVTVVDAPVSGGRGAAAEGELAVMIGAPDEAVDSLREAFSGWAGLIVHTGPVGSGTRTKIARNLLHFSAFAAVGEAMRLAEASGVDLGQLAKVIRHSDKYTGGPSAIMLRPTAQPMAEDDPLRPILEHASRLGVKDLSLAIDMAKQFEVDLALAKVARELLPSALGVADPPPGAAF